MNASEPLLETMNGPSRSKIKNGTASNTAADMERNFMTMLVARLKNQDPTDPVDNSEMTIQLAQLATVGRIETLNHIVSSMMPMQAAYMINHRVLAPGSNIQLTTVTTKNSDGIETKTHNAQFGTKLDTDADQVKATIRDSKDKVVRLIDFGKKDAGPVSLSWDGMQSDGKTIAPDGTYTFQIVATANGEAVQSTNLAFGTVSDVTIEASGATKLNVSNIGSINQSDLQKIF